MRGAWNGQRWEHGSFWERMRLDDAAGWLRWAAWVVLGLLVLTWLSGLAYINGVEPAEYEPDRSGPVAAAFTFAMLALSVLITAGLLGLARILNALEDAAEARAANRSLTTPDERARA